MSVRQVFISTIIMIVVMIGVMQKSCRADHFSLQQFSGVWYTAASINLQGNASDPVTCFRSNITRENGRQQNFKREYRLFTNGIKETYDGYGTIIGSIVTILFPYHTKKFVNTVEMYDNGQELIFHDLTEPVSYEVLSRSGGLAADTVKIIEDLVKKSNGQVTYNTQENCW